MKTGMIRMNEQALFEESVSSARTEAVFIALASVFFVLAAWRVWAAGFGWFSTILAIVAAMFIFYCLNYRTLRVRMNREALILRFGLFSKTIPWRDIHRAEFDQATLTRIAGAGIHFTFIQGRYRMYLNFLEHPRVVVALDSPGIVREVAFTTRRPDEVLAAIESLRNGPLASHRRSALVCGGSIMGPTPGKEADG